VPKSSVALVNGKPKIFVVNENCAFFLASFLCENPVIQLRSSTNDGTSWTLKTLASGKKDNFFPSVSADRSGSKVAVAWYTTGNDPLFRHRYDLELASFPASQA